MRSKVFSMVVVMICIRGFLGLTLADATNDSADPSALIGRWEGSARGLDSRWMSSFAIEIFTVDTAKKKVMYRWMCPEGEIGLQSPESRDWSGITWELKGDRLNGFSRRDTRAGSCALIVH